MKPGVRLLGPCKGGGVKVILGRRLRSDPELVLKVVEHETGKAFLEHTGKLKYRSIRADVPNGKRVVVAAIGQYDTGAVSTHGIDIIAPCAIEIEAAPQQAASPGADLHPSIQKPTPKALSSAVRGALNGRRVL